MDEKLVGYFYLDVENELITMWKLVVKIVKKLINDPRVCGLRVISLKLHAPKSFYPSLRLR